MKQIHRTLLVLSALELFCLGGLWWLGSVGVRETVTIDSGGWRTAFVLFVALGKCGVLLLLDLGAGWSLAGLAMWIGIRRDVLTFSGGKGS